MPIRDGDAFEYRYTYTWQMKDPKVHMPIWYLSVDPAWEDPKPTTLWQRIKAWWYRLVHEKQAQEVK